MRLALPLILVLCAACGDNGLTPDARERDEAGTDAYVPEPHAIAVAGDFGSPGVGTVARLAIDDLMMRQNVVAGAALGDPVLREIGGKLYIVNRFGSNNVTVLDAKTLAFEEQLSTGPNTNPQDIAVVGNKLYLPALGSAGVVVLTRGTGNRATIDLSSLDSVAPDDGLPDCVSAYAIGTKVYVACGLLDSFAAVENGKVVAIDSTTDTVVGTATMPYRNPYGFFVRAPESSVYVGDLLIATLPDFFNYATGCIVRVGTGATVTASCGLTNQQIAGFGNKLSVSPDGALLWLAVGTYDSGFTNPTGKLKGFDLQSGTLWPGAVSQADQFVVDVAACPGGQVVATDQTFGAAGLRVWKDSVERTASPLPIGVPPTINALVCYDP